MFRTLIFIVLLAILAQPTAAKQKKVTPSPAAKLSGALEAARFNAAERHIIRSVILQDAGRRDASAHSSLPPGLVKKTARGKALPPGWQKKIVPGKRLDYEVFRSGRPLPAEILKRLPPPLADTEIIRVNDTILRIQPETRIVLGMFDLFTN